MKLLCIHHTKQLIPKASVKFLYLSAFIIMLLHCFLYWLPITACIQFNVIFIKNRDKFGLKGLPITL